MGRGFLPLSSSILSSEPDMSGRPDDSMAPGPVDPNYPQSNTGRRFPINPFAASSDNNKRPISSTDDLEAILLRPVKSRGTVPFLAFDELDNILMRTDDLVSKDDVPLSCSSAHMRAPPSTSGSSGLAATQDHSDPFFGFDPGAAASSTSRPILAVHANVTPLPKKVVAMHELLGSAAIQATPRPSLHINGTSTIVPVCCALVTPIYHSPL